MFQAAAIVGYAQAAMEFVVGGVANTYFAHKAIGKARAGIERNGWVSVLDRSIYTTIHYRMHSCLRNIYGLKRIFYREKAC